MTPHLQAELVGPDGVLRMSVADALRDGGWTVAAERSPGARLDLGVFIPGDVPPNPLGKTPASDWWSSVDERLSSAFRCAKELTPRLSESSGALVFVSSLLGEIGSPGRTACSAASAGIIGLVKALTHDVPSVRFSAVTPVWPLPEEPWLGADVDWATSSPPRDGSTIGRAIAAAIVFLANDREGHLRGQIIRIPSGFTT
jgi:3-oxoacyl-[acyl-carrier protein] reductase